MRPSGDTARTFVFDDFVGKQLVHVSATSFRSGAERVNMVISFNLWGFGSWFQYEFSKLVLFLARAPADT